MATKFSSAARKASRSAANDAAPAPRRDIYADVTARIIAQLEAGVAPWVRPWSKSGAAPAMPCNAATGRRYSGINVMLLWGEAMARGFTSHGWMTFKQAADLGGHVRKGEKGSMIVFADSFVPGEEKAKAAADNRDARAVYYLKHFHVFNVDQVEGLPERCYARAEPVTEPEQIAASRALIRASGADLRIGGNKAFYSPGQDFIAVPAPQAFGDVINWNRTALHELTHWTGHKSRLARNILNEFGSKDYAREELVAEIGSAFLCASLGIEATVRHADYIGSWLSVLREDTGPARCRQRERLPR